MTEDWKVNAESNPASLATGNRPHKTTTTGLVPAERAVNAPAVERRVALEKRRRVAEMSKKEMQRLLLTSEVAGLPNRRAFDEAGAASAVAMSDLDGLKALNEFGYEVGNAVLKAKADALREAGLQAYHDKGDEFLCRSHSIKALLAQLERARAMLRDRTILVAQADGSTLSVTGADFSVGVGKDINEAEFLLKRHKAEREGGGEVARGKLCGITVKKDELESHLQNSARNHYLANYRQATPAKT